MRIQQDTSWKCLKLTKEDSITIERPISKKKKERKQKQITQRKTWKLKRPKQRSSKVSKAEAYGKASHQADFSKSLL